MVAGGTNPSPAWFKFRAKGFASTKGKRRPLPLKKYGVPTASYYNDRPMGYVESRKLEYVPKYSALIKDLPVMDALERLIKSGQSVMLIDGDGPPRDQYPNGMEMTEDNWTRMLDDPQARFGHGYVVARDLAKRCKLF